MNSLTLFIASVILFTIGSHGGDTCVSSSSFAIQSQNGRLEVNGAPISIKGANWWGLETSAFAPQGLDQVSLTSIMDFLQSNGFNGLRIPFSLDVALNPSTRHPTNINTGLNPTLAGMTSLQVLDQIFQAAAARGIVILLDQHVFDETQDASADPLWYSTSCITNIDGVCKTYTIQDDMDGWSNMITLFGKYWNFIGADLMNEPHGAARWGSGVSTNDWALAAAQIGNHIISSFPNWNGLIFVEGVELNPNCEITGFPGCETCTNDGHWWGGNLEGIRCATVGLSDKSRLVYSPHVYGTSVYDQPYFQATNFPDNLEYIYDTQWGFVPAATGNAVVIGEWGGFYTGTDKIIQDYQASYFLANKVDSTFYWCLNPNPGGDTDGLLETDWVTPNAPKITFLAGVHPTPTSFTASGSQVCLSGSAVAPANPTTLSTAATSTVATASTAATTTSTAASTATTAASTTASTATTTASTSIAAASSTASSIGSTVGGAAASSTTGQVGPIDAPTTSGAAFVNPSSTGGVPNLGATDHSGEDRNSDGSEALIEDSGSHTDSQELQSGSSTTGAEVHYSASNVVSASFAMIALVPFLAFLL